MNRARAVSVIIVFAGASILGGRSAIVAEARAGSRCSMPAAPVAVLVEVVRGDSMQSPFRAPHAAPRPVGLFPTARIRVLSIDSLSALNLELARATPSAIGAELTMQAAPYGPDCGLTPWTQSERWAVAGDTAYVRGVLHTANPFVAPALLVMQSWDYPYPRQRGLVRLAEMIANGGALPTTNAAKRADSVPLASARAVFSLDSLLRAVDEPFAAARPAWASRADRAEALQNWVDRNQADTNREPIRSRLALMSPR